MTPPPSDLILVSLLLLGGVVHAVLVSRRSHAPLQFTTALLQAIMVEAAVVVLLSFVHPAIVSIDNRNAFVALIAMMTLIYAIRDIFDGYDRRRVHKDNEHRNRA